MTGRWNMVDPRITRRQWLTISAMRSGANPLLAIEAVASVAIEHPEWDMDELRTFAEWEAGDDSG
jgi:hypothetical protein